MKVLFYIYFLLIPIGLSFSYDIGGAFSLDYYNNPVEDSAPSPFQERLVLFHNFDRDQFSLRSGLGFLSSFYEIQGDRPVFGDYWAGFNTLEIDIFTYPGYSIDLNESLNVGLSAGGGFRLPIVTKVDDGVDHDEAFLWFYEDFHFLFVGGSIFTRIKLPMGDDSARLFFSANYTNFVTRGNEWTVGATAGMLWRIN